MIATNPESCDTAATAASGQFKMHPILVRAGRGTGRKQQYKLFQ